MTVLLLDELYEGFALMQIRPLPVRPYDDEYAPQ